MPCLSLVVPSAQSSSTPQIQLHLAMCCIRCLISPSELITFAGEYHSAQCPDVSNTQPQNAMMIMAFDGHPQNAMISSMPKQRTWAFDNIQLCWRAARSKDLPSKRLHHAHHHSSAMQHHRDAQALSTPPVRLRAIPKFHLGSLATLAHRQPPRLLPLRGRSRHPTPRRQAARVPGAEALVNGLRQIGRAHV